MSAATDPSETSFLTSGDRGQSGPIRKDVDAAMQSEDSVEAVVNSKDSAGRIGSGGRQGGRLRACTKKGQRMNTAKDRTASAIKRSQQRR